MRSTDDVEKIAKGSLALGTTAALLLAVVALSLSACTGSQPKQTKLDCEKIGLADFPYSAFVKNWDEEKFPLFYALIDSQEEFDEVFGAAAFGGNTKPYAPEPGFFTSYCLVLAVRVVSPSADNSPLFSEASLSAERGALSLSYTFVPAKQAASFSVSDGLVYKLRRGEYTSLKIIENSQTAGELDLAKGQWVVSKK